MASSCALVKTNSLPLSACEFSVPASEFSRLSVGKTGRMINPDCTMRATTAQVFSQSQPRTALINSLHRGHRFLVETTKLEKSFNFELAKNNYYWQYLT